MNDINELPPFWDTVIAVMAKYIEDRQDPWTLQTTGGNYDFAPYVQALQEHDNMLLLEATSSKYLEPPLTQEQHEVMLFLGWRHFPEEMYPNYSQILDQSIFTPNEIAKLLAKTLHFAYGVDNSFNFEIAPYRSDAALVIHEEESTVSTDDFLIERVRKPYPPGTPVVALSTPVVSFGNPNISRVATVGINPSRREFEGRDRGARLENDRKRLVDLNTLGAKSCDSITHDQAREVLEGCFDYFAGTTHYGEWFDPLEQAVLNPIEASYFGKKTYSAVHLDLVQWATDPVWSQIEDRELASTLLEEDSGFLRKQLQTYDFTYIFLNGKEVCEQIQNLGIYELSHVGDLQWKSGEGSRTSKIYTGVGKKGEIVVGWTLNIQGMKVTNQERSRIYAEIAKWIQICIQAKGASKDTIHIPLDAGATVGYEELAEAYIKTIHFETVYHPDYWSTFIELLRAALEISKGDDCARWLDYVVNDIRMTTRIMPTEEALELSVDIPPGVAQDATYKKFSKEIDRMRLYLVEINREFLRVLIREILGERASKRIPMAQLIAAGLPPVEPEWSVFEWAKEI
jgi:hypothetical protein